MALKRFLGPVLGAALVALPAAGHASQIYATAIDWTAGAGVGSDPARYDPDNALGPPNGAFLSLGLGGQADFTFARPFKSPGKVWEITFGNRSGYPETAEVSVGTGGAFTSLGQIDNSSGSSSFNFSGTFDTVRIVDTTTSASPSFDGYDVDAVGVSPVPLPAPALLLVAALGGLGVVSRVRA